MSKATKLRRRGITYIMVLGTTMLVAVITLGALQSVRSQTRMSRMIGDASSAADLASSAISHGQLLIKNNSLWRLFYASGSWSSEQSLGGGFFQWKVVDASTGSSVLHEGVLPKDDFNPVRIYGKGRIGNVVHTMSVEINFSKKPYDAVRSAIHAQGNVSINSGDSFNVVGGPFSTAGSFTNAIPFNGNVEALSISGSGTISGIQTTNAPTKTVPPDNVFDYYRSIATTIPWTTAYFPLSGGKYLIKTNILTPTMSQFVTPVTNPNGVYYVSVPGGLGKLQIDWVRINGTILFDVQGSGTTILFGGHILWTPIRPDYPMSLIRNASTVELDAQGMHGALTEGGNNNGAGNANYNPPGFPYNSVTDTDTSDSYESRLFGLTHVIGGVGGTPTATVIFTQLRTTGCVIVPGAVTYPGGSATPIDATLTWDSSYATNPPYGYYTVEMTPTPGSWRQELAP
jgi:hypothetical protein